MIIIESWGVNGHTTRCTSPVSVVLWLQLVSGRELQGTEISATLLAHRAKEGHFLSKSDSKNEKAYLS